MLKRARKGSILGLFPTRFDVVRSDEKTWRMGLFRGPKLLQSYHFLSEHFFIGQSDFPKHRVQCRDLLDKETFSQSFDNRQSFCTVGSASSIALPLFGPVKHSISFLPALSKHRAPAKNFITYTIRRKPIPKGGSDHVLPLGMVFFGRSVGRSEQIRLRKGSTGQCIPGTG